MAQANVTVGIKSSVFKQGLDDMRSQAKQWGGDIKSTIAGAFALGAVTSFVSGFMSEMARVKDLSDRLGESSTTIQRVGNAAKLSGSDLEFVVTTLNKLTLAAAKGAEKFEEAGINAAAFANAGMEEKILMLAGAYEEAGDSQDKMLKLMELLGNKGQDMLIMLSQGVDGLTEAMDEASIASEGVVDAMASLDDQIDSTKMASAAWLGEFLLGCANVVKSIAAISGSLYFLQVELLKTAASFGIGTAAKDSIKETKNAYEALLKSLDEIWNPKAPEPSGRNKNFDLEQRDAEAAAKRAAQAGKNLEEEMLSLARSRMDAEQKITDLKREQAEHEAKSMGPTKDLETQRDEYRKVIELQQEIEAGEKDIAKKKADEEEKAAQKKRDADKAAMQAEESLSAEASKQLLEKMDPKKRIELLKKQQKDLNESASTDPDRKSSAEKKLEALKLNEVIDSAEKELGEKKKTTNSSPSVISSSLASIGGGGGAYIGTDPALAESRKQTSLLQQIARGLNGAGVTHFSPPKTPF